MSIVTRPVRHREAAPRGSTTINIDLGSPLARRPAARAATRDAAADIVSSLNKMGRDLDVIGQNMQRTRDGLARLQPIVEARKASTAAAARDAAIAVRSSPASVQAANAARWPRPGR